MHRNQIPRRKKQPHKKDIPKFRSEQERELLSASVLLDESGELMVIISLSLLLACLLTYSSFVAFWSTLFLGGRCINGFTRYSHAQSLSPRGNPIQQIRCGRLWLWVRETQRYKEDRMAHLLLMTGDYRYYNRTLYGGLETNIRNSYCNSLLQVLYFILPLRQIAKCHICTSCDKENCLMCELGFLFRMLEDSNGQNCQATNFLKAFSTISQGKRGRGYERLCEHTHVFSF